MKIISHRGNINGIVQDRENRPSYIDAALQLGYDVEIDIRLINDEFWLGHDVPQYKVDLNWLNLRKKNIWLHCKDKNSAMEFVKLNNEFNFFCHSSDPYVLISNNMLWVHDLRSKIDTNCIIPLLSETDINDYNNDIPYAICTDFVVLIKNNNE